MNWLSHFFGIDNEAGSHYAFWSGAGSDIGELAMVGAFYALIRHHNCHTKGCWRIGRLKFAADGTEYLLCHRHHPTGQPTHAEIKERAAR